ncbi:stage II sporulation protein D [Lutispora thermophila]|uniref:Stage II sporulation protein D n=1 Tax=Lutispora thermophila DSM 19022 TaxID=1122184 RepID=A0A1M6AND9_9FIRM|nr:stage II sporulation protein D [Lutispora thermophila]SHI37982.1 stage II sporulation protein D [Lutispora thermophila DSM 19022]
MKRYALSIIFLIFLLFALPVAIISCSKESLPEKRISDSKLYLNVYDYRKEKLITMDLEEYIAGVVAAEMPATFHIEALKAQALAARTYTLLRMKYFGGKGCSQHPEADICTDPSHCQAFVDPNTLGKNQKKIYEAVNSTKGEVIVYEDKLIDAVFHSTSGGITENSEDVWVNKVPYLRSVLSQYEDHSPKLISRKEISIDDFVSGMLSLDNTITLDKKNLESQIQIIERSSGGRVMKIKIGDKYFSGRDIREQFGLNSTNFSIDIGKNRITFEVIGYGHGIGMSQYGADGMANHGATYQEIIKHYYTGVEIVPLESLQ